MINSKNNMKMVKKRKKTISAVVTYILLIIIACFSAGPFIWIVSTSLKSGQNIYEMSLIPKHPTFANYIGIFQYMNIPKYIINTVIITVGAIAIDIVFSSLCAYPLACMDFYGKKIIMVLLISTMILPSSAGMIVNYLVIKKLHLLNTFLGVILPGSVTVFGIILMRQSYLSIPKEMIEAAKIDGASEIKVWYKIMVPEIMPAISTLIIFDFISHWNAFLWPIIVLNDPNKYPLATALKFLNGQFSYKFGFIASGTVISIVPVIIIFLMFQKYFINSVAGAVKS